MLPSVATALSGMWGAGLFVGSAGAAGAAGGWCLLGIPIAALAAYSCAVASSELGEQYAGPGAAHACIRARLGVAPARMATGAYLVGLTAAMAAIAKAIGEHLLPHAPSAVAITVLLLVVLASTTGLRIRGFAAGIWTAVTLSVLALVVITCFAIGPVAPATPVAGTSSGSAVGIIPAAGVMFFAFLGFERITAPAAGGDRVGRWRAHRALAPAIAATALVAVIVTGALLYQLGPARLAVSPAPLVDALGAADASGLLRPVEAGAAIAMVPALLGVFELFRSEAQGVLREGDLPAGLGRTGSHGTLYLLEVLVALAAGGLSLVLEPATAIAFAACCVLVHHAFASAGARVLLMDGPTWSMRLSCFALGICVVLAMSASVPVLIATLATVLAGPVLAGWRTGRWR